MKEEKYFHNIFFFAPFLLSSLPWIVFHLFSLSPVISPHNLSIFSRICYWQIFLKRSGGHILSYRQFPLSWRGARAQHTRKTEAVPRCQNEVKTRQNTPKIIAWKLLCPYTRSDPISLSPNPKPCILLIAISPGNQFLPQRWLVGKLSVGVDTRALKQQVNYACSTT
jgi:hypothetical protein